MEFTTDKASKCVTEGDDDTQEDNKCVSQLTDKKHVLAGRTLVFTIPIGVAKDIIRWSKSDSDGQATRYQGRGGIFKIKMPQGISNSTNYTEDEIFLPDWGEHCQW